MKFVLQICAGFAIVYLLQAFVFLLFYTYENGKTEVSQDPQLIIMVALISIAFSSLIQALSLINKE